MTINVDLLTPAERAIYERQGRVATSDVLVLLDALCEQRQAVLRAAVQIERAHDLLDDYNAGHGSADALCAFCHAAAYNGCHGIDHEGGCPILELRAAHLSLKVPEPVS